MANEVSKATQNFFEKYGEAAAPRNIIGRLLKFNKFGEYRAGQEEEEITRGTTLAAYMPSLAVGYMRWEDGKPVEIIMGPIGPKGTYRRRARNWGTSTSRSGTPPTMASRATRCSSQIR